MERLVVKERDEVEPDPKRRLTQVKGSEAAATASDRTITERGVIVHKTSEVDVFLSDGYRWRKYAQTFVDGNPNPRTYFQCPTSNCPATKVVERTAKDPRTLVSIYEGKHNHDLSAAKLSSHDESSEYSFDGSLPKTLQPSFLKLRFVNSPAPTISTYKNIDAEDGSPIRIELIDTPTNTRVPLDSILFSGLEIVPLNADIAEEIWTTEEFNRNILYSRDQKQPLLIGDRTMTLKDGFGVISGYVGFTDNSIWLRSGKFRLGAKFTKGGAMEAITKAFVCIDNPTGASQKHYPDSEVWRLNLVPKDGVTELRLRQAGIYTVKDLRRHLSMNQNAIPRELKGKIKENRWNRIVSQSMHCVLDESECYIYNSEAHGASLLFNSVYEVMKVSFDGIIVLNTTDFTSTQQVLLDNLKREAYENTNSLVAVNSADFVSFLPRSSKNQQDTELSNDFPESQSIFVDGASSDTSDAFEPQSTSATLSASKHHDVVIRYGKGDITNDDFISHLCAALWRRGISVYEEFVEVDAVPQCSVLIILLTSTYVPSNLLNILEHQQVEDGVVYPIFYRLSPYDLISNIKNYERFFLQEEPKRWQTALKEITQMHGSTLTDKSESELIDEIVRDTSKVLYSGNKVDTIGMDTQVEEILSLLRIAALDVRSIGIWGTVGIGKTTIAEDIFRRVSVQYETCLFLKDLHKEVEDKGHDTVREEFLSKVLDVAPHIIRISDIKTSFLRSRLQHKS